MEEKRPFWLDTDGGDTIQVCTPVHHYPGEPRIIVQCFNSMKPAKNLSWLYIN